MESEQQTQTLPAKATNNRWKRLLPVATSPSAPGSDDEGGLQLGQLVGALQRRWPVILGVTTVVTSVAFIRALNSDPIYQSIFEVLTKPVTVESQVISSLPQTLSNKEQQASAEGIDATTLRLLKSPKLLNPIVEKLKVKYPSLSYGALSSNLAIVQIPNTKIIQVVYRDPDLRKVKDVMDLLSAAYLNYSLEERLADVRQGILFVDKQLPQLRERVEDLQENLQTFRQQYNLVDPDAQGRQLSEQLGAFSREKLTAEVAINEANALLADIQQQLNELPVEEYVGAEARSNPRYQRLLDRLLEVDSQLALESGLYSDESNNIRLLRDQRENLLPLLKREGQRIQAELADRIQTLEARNQALNEAETFLNNRIKQLSVISRRYTDIQRELQIATENLNQFLAKREALRIDAGQRQVPWQLLSPPGDPFPSDTSTKQTLALGAILGVLLGVGLALVLDRFDSVIYSPEELKSAARLPLLGITPWIPAIKEESGEGATLSFSSLLKDASLGAVSPTHPAIQAESSMNGYLTAPVAESFRSIFTNIRLMNPDAPVRSLVITSPDAQDGKSTVAANLALAAAVMAQRVLLVDTDLRLPRLHERLNLSNSLGLCDVIASPNLDWQDAIQKSPDEENLFILTSGHVPPDPVRLLSSQKFRDLMHELEASFDLVIYDTPPLVGLSDVSLVASHTDALVLVFGLGKTSRAILNQALEILKLPPTLVLGIIANGSKDISANSYGPYKRALR